MNPPLVQESSVAAAEIDQPKLANILQMDQRVPARHVGRFQHDRISGAPSERTATLDRMACAIGRFQPGTFLLGVHHSDSTKATSIRKASQLGRVSAGKPEEALQEQPF